MKIYPITMLGIMSMATTSITAYAQEQVEMTHTASYIEMTAADNREADLASFLANAAPLVNDTEPGTLMWFALQGPENTMAIFDIFEDETARDAHFSGVVANALKDNADQLVEGGWEKGVVANINHSSVLSAKAPVDLYTATTATYIRLEAASGQGDALAELLTAAGPIVSETEPETLYWVALRMDESNFALFDIFADDSGREAHFAGQVANLLKEKSSLLVEGGWDEGVVANVTHSAILAIK